MICPWTSPRLATDELRHLTALQSYHVLEDKDPFISMYKMVQPNVDLLEANEHVSLG